MTAIARPKEIASARDAATARKSRQRLARLAKSGRSIVLHTGDQARETIELPASAVHLLLDILKALGSGVGVTILPENAELTTAQAAAILHVSRPFLIKQLENDEIPYRKIGKHRRIRMEDVAAVQEAN